MALLSPGVQVSIIDQSQYLPAPPSSIPFFLVATAQNKANPNDVGVAQATTAAEANKLYTVTSQRDLVTLYGTPFFYTASDGTPIQGYELNEYGLLAAYSALGVSNQAYVLRADIDLASLVGQTGRPSAAPTSGTWWYDTATTTWGIYEWNATTSSFTNKIPTVITDVADLTGDYPSASVGAPNTYAVVSIANYNSPTSNNPTYFYKTTDGTWVGLGTNDWLSAWPTVQGTEAPTTLTSGFEFTINVNGKFTRTITVPAATNNTVTGVASVINALSITNLSAANVDGKLQIYLGLDDGDITDDIYITLANSTGTPLTELGITPGTYYQPELFYGKSQQQPLWSSSQSVPRPTGSVWLKMGSSGAGFVPAVSIYDSTLATFVPKSTSVQTGDVAALAALDPTGGQAIPADTIYAQYNYNDNWNQGPVYLWKRAATGPTVITGDDTSPSFTNGPYTATIYVSVPNSTSLSAGYAFSLADNSDATDFATAWAAAGVPYTECTVLTSGEIQLTHTEGGIIVVDDVFDGTSNGLMSDAGFTINSTTGVKYGDFVPFSGIFAVDSTSGTGVNAVIGITNVNGVYSVTGISVAGTGYAVGNTITINGATLYGATPANNLVLLVQSINGSGGITGLAYESGTPIQGYETQLSNWVEFEYTPQATTLTADPANNTNWYYSVNNQVDIMVNTTSGWVGYRNTNFDSNGFPSPSGSNTTDPNGPLTSATAPTTQSDGTVLVPGDLWIDTGDLENYPMIYRWQLTIGQPTGEWILIDNSDQTDGSGVLFADARWATNGTTDPVNDPIPTIKSLLSSNYLDLDAPDPDLYPVGMLLFNTRRSGYNVKQFRINYFNSTSFPDQTLPTETNAWVSVSGLQSNGSPYMGRKAQRAMVVQALRSSIDSNLSIRDEDTFFNILACPNYPELQPNMITLNADRGETGFIVGDTPLRLADSGTAIAAWATNAAGATSTGEEGLVTRNTYMGLFYPSGLTNDLSGNQVVVPASHMMVRTLIRNDTIAFPWFAPAGTRRGIIDNALSIGYLDSATGEFVSTKTRVGIRDVLYVNFINPLVFFTGNGLLNYGNKSSFDSQSALDRVNVARLVAYLRRQLTIAARPFIFEPNDAFTRAQVSTVMQTLLNDLIANRGVYDYSVVCDDSNNTPARIDRNELWVDIAIQPVKAVEFIYIPVRILNTGESVQGTGI